MAIYGISINIHIFVNINLAYFRVKFTQNEQCHVKYIKGK